MSYRRGEWRLWFGVVLLAWSSFLRGQESASVDQLMVRAQEALSGMPHLEVTATTRSIEAVSSQSPDAVDGQRIIGAYYQRMRITHRQPDDWRLASQREREMQIGRALSERTLVFGKLGADDGVMLLLNTITREPARAPIPAALFRQEVLERAGPMLRTDPVLNALFLNRSDTGAAAFGLANVSRVGSDVVNGVRLTRLSAGGTTEQRLTIWLDESTGLITRVLGATPYPGSIRRFTETIYTYDLSRGDDASDFDLAKGWAEAKPGFSATAGFVPVAQVLALLGRSGDADTRRSAFRPDGRPTPPSPGGPTSPSGPTSPPAAVTATPVPAPAAPVVEDQLLTPLQMESIVLVEGEEGVGSGFVARIRDVDFVVTNQHVIGGNEKLRITTLRGLPIKVGSIFGAVGRDIAILRIEGENTVPALKIADDPVKTIKLGDKVAVVGNRRGGGVATQVSGVVRGIGPDKIEVDAPFQPGNSGSPIVHVPTGEVIGLATYSLTRKLDALDGPAGANSSKSSDKEPATEQRWFGHRADGIAKWEAVDLAKWRAQAKRVESFASDSEAIYYAMYGRFKEASSNPRVRQLIDRFEERINKFNASQSLSTQEVQEFFRSLRALAEGGVKDLKTGDYYDFFRTSMYWETSITEQLRAREDIMHRLEKASGNSAAILERLRR